MPDDRGRVEPGGRGCDIYPGVPLRGAGRARAHAQRQRAGVYRRGGPGVAGPARIEDAVHRAGSPWENAYSETFNSRLRDELLDREEFETLKEAKVIDEVHRLDYNHRRPHSS